MCPHLHTFCGISSSVVNGTGMHGFGLEKSPLQLRNDFKEFRHMGKFTFIQFLYGNIRSHQLGRNSLYRGQGHHWIYSGLNATLPDDMLHLKL
jgi:hypothetical protein